jgi:predicted O-methyltransferase YrrM
MAGASLPVAVALFWRLVLSTAVESIIEQVKDSPLALANLARTLLASKGDLERAMDLCDQAVALAPWDEEIKAIRAEVLSIDVARWYFSMVRDEERHAAYDRVLRRALRDGGRVLDIGTGTGLFAMMAARAGADEVITCDRRPAVVRGARAVIAANALEDRITVIGKQSADLKIGVDLPGAADVLIWDNLANNLVGVGALPAIEDAMRRLVRPGGAVVPARCEIKAALAEDRSLDRRRMSRVAGFDMSPFNALARPEYTVPCGSIDLAVRSSATTLFEFDFRYGDAHLAERALREVVGAGGPANGVVQWLVFHLDDEEIYETAPGRSADAFGLEFHPAASAFEAEAGKTFTIGAAHDRERVRVWVEKRA